MGCRKEGVLVSACLLGRRCRYDGGHKHRPELERRLEAEGLVAVPFCPEEEGGLATPRPAAWIEARGAGAVLEGLDRVRTQDGGDATEAFLAGARAARERCRALGLERAILKEGSPSCGVTTTTVAGRRVRGPGVTAEALRRDGIEVRGA